MRRWYYKHTVKFLASFSIYLQRISYLVFQENRKTKETLCNDGIIVAVVSSLFKLWQQNIVFCGGAGIENKQWKNPWMCMYCDINETLNPSSCYVLRTS